MKAKSNHYEGDRRDGQSSHRALSIEHKEARLGDYSNIVVSALKAKKARLGTLYGVHGRIKEILQEVPNDGFEIIALFGSELLGSISWDVAGNFPLLLAFFSMS